MVEGEKYITMAEYARDMETWIQEMQVDIKKNSQEHFRVLCAK